MIEREFNGKMTRPKLGLVISLFILLLTFTGIPNGISQWNKIATFDIPDTSFGSVILLESIYFLNLPGQPKIGFAGLSVPSKDNSISPDDEMQLWKTTDGGYNWRKVLPSNGRALLGHGVAGIVFKDSLTGWLAQDWGPNPITVYNTTDAGETWIALSNTGTGINYSLYIGPSNTLYLPRQGYSLFSSDEGVTWQKSLPLFLSSVFSSDYVGILCGSGTAPYSVFYPSTFNYYTIDQGQSWHQINFGADCFHPLAIPNTGIFFATEDSTGGYNSTTYTDSNYRKLYRSNDSGKTWNFVSFIPCDSINPIAFSSDLEGDLHHIYTQSSAGVFVSTDEGLTWQNLCGPKFPSLESNQIHGGFYQKGKYIYCSSGQENNDSVHLWYLNLDSLNLISSTFSEQFDNGSKRETIHSGDTVRVDFLSDTALGPAVGVDSVSISISYDNLSLALTYFVPTSGWSIKDSFSAGGYYHLLLVASDTLSLANPNKLLRGVFASYLDGDNHPLPPPSKGWGSNKVYLDSIHLYGHRLNCDCPVESVLGVNSASLASALDSVEVDLTGCGDSVLRLFMSGKSLFEIVSIQPNPASSSIDIGVRGSGSVALDIEMRDVLGQTVLTQHSGSDVRSTSLRLDVSSIPSGTYFLRLSQNGFVQSRRIAIER